jgi:hypothetical protein
MGNDILSSSVHHYRPHIHLYLSTQLLNFCIGRFHILAGNSDWLLVWQSLQAPKMNQSQHWIHKDVEVRRFHRDMK